MTTLKDMLVYLRKRDGLSQRELAEKIGVSPSTIGMYESGKRFPTHEIEEALADIFNVNLNILRGIDDEVAPVQQNEFDDFEMDLMRSFKEADPDTQKVIINLLALSKKLKKEAGDN